MDILVLFQLAKDFLTALKSGDWRATIAIGGKLLTAIGALLTPTPLEPQRAPMQLAALAAVEGDTLEGLTSKLDAALATPPTQAGPFIELIKPLLWSILKKLIFG